MSIQSRSQILNAYFCLHIYDEIVRERSHIQIRIHERGGLEYHQLNNSTSYFVDGIDMSLILAQVSLVTKAAEDFNFLTVSMAAC